MAKVGTGFKIGLGNLIDATGTITSASESATRMVKELGKRQEAMQTRLDDIEARYVKKFSALDTLIAGMNQTASSLTSLLSNLSNNNNN